MMFPFNNKLRIWAAQTSDYTYLWLLIHEPRDIHGERWEICICRDFILGSCQKVEEFG